MGVMQERRNHTRWDGTQLGRFLLSVLRIPESLLLFYLWGFRGFSWL